jgi:hypothetical protein
MVWNHQAYQGMSLSKFYRMMIFYLKLLNKILTEIIDEIQILENNQPLNYYKER